jgi:cold-inducible RNA-binding protein
MDIYVGNLPYTTTEAELESLFSQYGTVAKVKVVMDFATGRSKGFGFVTMDDQAERQAAVNGLNGQAFGGRPLKVNEAQPRENRPPRSFDGPRPPRGEYGGGGGGGGGGGRRDFGGKGRGGPPRGGDDYRGGGGGGGGDYRGRSY